MVNNLNFLGRGLRHPFRFSKAGSSSQTFGASLTEGVEHLKGCLIQLIYTQIKERFFLRSFGTRLGRLVFEPQQELLIKEIISEMADSVKKWEKRIKINDLKLLEMNPKDGRIVISLSFSVINSNVTGNLVFPYYLADQNSNRFAGVLDTQMG